MYHLVAVALGVACLALVTLSFRLILDPDRHPAGAIALLGSGALVGLIAFAMSTIDMVAHAEVLMQQVRQHPVLSVFTIFLVIVVPSVAIPIAVSDDPHRTSMRSTLTGIVALVAIGMAVVVAKLS